MEMYEVRPNAVLMCHFNGGPLEPVKVLNPKIKKVLVQRESGERWDVYPYSLHPNTDEVPFNLKVDEATGLTLGTVVKFKLGHRPGMWVIVGTDRGSGYKAYPMFGSRTGLKDLPATMLEVVDREALKAYLSYTSV